MFWCHRIRAWQVGHRERGKIKDISLGSRWMQTFTKLPMQEPTTKIQNITTTFGLNSLFSKKAYSRREDVQG